MGSAGRGADPEARRDNVVCVRRKGLARCMPELPYVAGFITVAAAPRDQLCRYGRLRSRRERPPDFWPWFGRGAGADVHRAAPPFRGVAPVHNRSLREGGRANRARCGGCPVRDHDRIDAYEDTDG